MLKKTTLKLLSTAALIGLAGPALADPPRWAPAHGHRYAHRTEVAKHHHYRPHARRVIVHRTVHVRHAPVVVRRVYVSRPVYVAPPPVVVHPAPAYYGPAPVHVTSSGTLLGTLGGAAIGAAVGSQIGKGSGNTAAIAVGAVLGGMIGSGHY